MSHINTDIKISGYWVRLPRETRVKEERTFTDFMEAIENGLLILKKDRCDFVEVIELIDSNSGYYERVFRVRARINN